MPKPALAAKKWFIKNNGYHVDDYDPNSRIEKPFSRNISIGSRNEKAHKVCRRLEELGLVEQVRGPQRSESWITLYHYEGPLVDATFTYCSGLGIDSLEVRVASAKEYKALRQILELDRTGALTN